MNQFLLVALLGTLCVSNAQLNPSVLARGLGFPDKTKWTPFACRSNGVFTPSDERGAEVHACKTKTGTAECLSSCQAGALGLVNADGTTSFEIYEQWVMESFPEEHKTVAKSHFQNCFEKFGQRADTTDTCIISKEFAECTWNVVPLLKCTPAATV